MHLVELGALVSDPTPSGGWRAERAVSGAAYGDRRAMQARSWPPRPAAHRPEFDQMHQTFAGASRSLSAFSTLGGDIGSSVKRMPVACSMALAMAPSGGTIGVSPTPRTP